MRKFIITITFIMISLGLSACSREREILDYEANISPKLTSTPRPTATPLPKNNPVFDYTPKEDNKENKNDTNKNISLKLPDNSEDYKDFSGKIIDTEVDFSIFQIDPSVDKNHIDGVNAEDYEDFLTYLNTYIIDYYNNYIFKIQQYTDDELFYSQNNITIENCIYNLKNITKSIDSKHKAIKDRVAHDQELYNAWKLYYEAIKSNSEIILNIDKHNVDSIDYKLILETTDSLAQKIQLRIE